MSAWREVANRSAVGGVFVYLLINMVADSVLAQSITGMSIVYPIIAPKISSNYGIRKHPIMKSVRHHDGVDLQAPMNSHVRTVAEGQVIFADTLGNYGKLVAVHHKDGYTSLYGHLSEIRVEPGAYVNAGDVIGRVGDTGSATGPHLHFEWRQNGKALDPVKIFPGLAARAEG